MKVTFYRAIGVMIAMLVLLVMASGCSDDNNPTTPNNNQHSSHYHNLTIAGLAFSPATITIGVGDTCVWRNNDAAAHTVTSDAGGELSSPQLSQGQTYQHIFLTAGTFAYHCEVHPTMHGSVTVQ